MVNINPFQFVTLSTVDNLSTVYSIFKLIKSKYIIWVVSIIQLAPSCHQYSPALSSAELQSDSVFQVARLAEVRH